MASERCEVKISTPVCEFGSRRALVRYMVVPSGVKDMIPSSNSVFSSPSTVSGRCHSPFSFLRDIHMSLFFMPVISLFWLPVTFSFVVAKYITSACAGSRNIGAKSERRELKSLAFFTT